MLLRIKGIFSNYHSKGFTLIELLIVIAIIGILAALIIISLAGARNKATDTQLKNNLRNLNTAMEQYYQDNSLYPSFITAGGGGGTATAMRDIVPTGATDCNGATAGVGVFGDCMSPYVTGALASQIWVYSGVDAKYITNATAKWMAATALKNTSEAVITAGNGIYANSGSVVANGLTVTGMQATNASATKAFVVYGPQ